MATVDLWPDEIATDGGLEGPTVLLKEQAALLGQKTKNVVEAEVKSHATNSGQEFVDVFVITSPALNYHHALFRVDYPLEFFPAWVIWADFDRYDAQMSNLPAREVSSLEELKQTLQEIFAAPKTVRIIQALISRSRS